MDTGDCASSEPSSEPYRGEDIGVLQGRPGEEITPPPSVPSHTPDPSSGGGRPEIGGEGADSSSEEPSQRTPSDCPSRTNHLTGEPWALGGEGGDGPPGVSIPGGEAVASDQGAKRG